MRRSSTTYKKSVLQGLTKHRRHRRNKKTVRPNRCVLNPSIRRSKGPWAVLPCRIANEEHASDKRQYAHTFHRRDVICVADAYEALPDSWRLAVLLHEMGHLLAGPRGGEKAANKKIKEATGITIRYKDGRHGEALEWISPADKKRAIELLEVA